jgi:hypothetical protein
MSRGDNNPVNSLFKTNRRNKSILLGFSKSRFLSDLCVSVVAVCVLSIYEVPCRAVEVGGDEPSPSHNPQSEINSDLVFVQRFLNECKIFASDSLSLDVWLTPLIPQTDVFTRTPVGSN